MIWLCIQVEPSKKATMLQAYLKKKKPFNSVINSFKRLHFSHTEMKTDPVCERLREVFVQYVYV
jgi:hypothetical protein